MLQVWKFSYVWFRYLRLFNEIKVLRFLQTSVSSFTKFVFLGSLAREKGEASSAFLEIGRSDLNYCRKCPDYENLWVDFTLKIQFQEQLGEKNPKLCLVCLLQLKVSRSSLISRNLLCPENVWSHAQSTTLLD